MMKFSFLILSSFLSLLILSACGAGSSADDDSSSSSNNSSTTLRSCDQVPASSFTTEPDPTSIENLFGCVTLTETLSSGTVSNDYIVFTAESEGNLIAGGRSVRGTTRFSNVLCSEVVFDYADFLCATTFINTITYFKLTMDSQFEGTGTAQLCFNDNQCNLEGTEFPENPATISITRGDLLVAGGTRLNGEPISELELHDYRLADAYQFATTTVTGSSEQNAHYQSAGSELSAALRSLEQ